MTKYAEPSNIPHHNLSGEVIKAFIFYAAVCIQNLHIQYKP